MPQYKLYYFDIRGRAEITRLLFKQACVEFEDKRLTKEEWAAMKPGECGTLEISFHTSKYLWGAEGLQSKICWSLTASQS